MNSFHFEHNTPQEGKNKIFLQLLHCAIMHLAQAKLYFCRAIHQIPDERHPRLRRVLESLTGALQFAIDTAQRLGVSR
jgi:hypothetical protein